MGGGGGGYRVGPDDIDEIKREVDQRTERSMAEAEINELLSRELTRINFRDTEATSRLLDAIAEALGDEIEFQRLGFGGSIAKHTYVDGLSDVDSLLYFHGEDVQGMSPADLRDHLAETLQANLPKGDVENIRPGNLAVTITYTDGTEIQLVPIRETRDHSTQISSADGSHWKSIEPHKFAQDLTRVNQEQAGAVVPAIKLAKGIIDSLPEQAHLSGYHVEALAVAAFTGYKGPHTPREMLTHLFSSAVEGIKRPISDSTGQSRHIDEDFGAANSAARQRASQELDRVASQMKDAANAEQWRALLGS